MIHTDDAINKNKENSRLLTLFSAKYAYTAFSTKPKKNTQPNNGSSATASQSGGRLWLDPLDIPSLNNRELFSDLVGEENANKHYENLHQQYQNAKSKEDLRAIKKLIARIGELHDAHLKVTGDDKSHIQVRSTQEELSRAIASACNQGPGL